MTTIPAEGGKVDVLIAGAGPAGLTLAIELARRGVSFRLVDKAEGPFTGSRGKGIQPRSQEVFEDMGVLGELRARGGPYPPVRRHEGGEAVDQPLSAPPALNPAEPWSSSLMIPQHQTEAVLRDRLSVLGGRPRYGVELLAIEQNSRAIHATVRSAGRQDVVQARYLVGADGGRSFVRRAIGVNFVGETRPGRSLVADVELDGFDRHAWHMWPKAPGGLFALCPLPRTNLFQLMAEIGAEASPLPSLEDLRTLIAERTGRRDARVRRVAWISVWQVNLRLADRYRVGRALLIGDAAHAHPPTGGQGLNTSIQDAYNLGWKLAAVLEGAPEPLLDTYEDERRPVAEGVLELSGALLSAWKKPEGMRRGRNAQQLDITYRGSALAVDRRARPGRVQAGDRAPDARFQFDGQRVRLFERLSRPDFLLLDYGVQGQAGQEMAARLGVRSVAVAPRGLPDGAEGWDVDGELADHYDLEPGTRVLFRPDNHIAAMADIGGRDAVGDWWARWMTPQTQSATGSM